MFNQSKFLGSLHFDTPPGVRLQDDIPKVHDGL